MRPSRRSGPRPGPSHKVLLFIPHLQQGGAERHRRGEDHGERIWNLLVLELWHREVLDRRAVSAVRAAG